MKLPRVEAGEPAQRRGAVRLSRIEDHFSGRQAHEDDDLNLMGSGDRTESPELSWDLIQTFLKAKFNAPRPARRLRRVAELENQ